MAAIDVREVAFPELASKPGQQAKNALSIAGDGFTLGVLYAHEPFMSGNKLGIHVSISKSSAGRPAKVTQQDVDEVMRVCLSRGLSWPSRQETNSFEAGPFAGLGVHVWQAE